MKTKAVLIHCLLVCVLLFSSACGSNKDESVEIPKGILSEDVFVKILRDFALAESAGTLNIKALPGFKTDSAYAFNPLIENNVRQSQYDSTIAFYIDNPELYKKVYENVLAELTKLQAKRVFAAKDSVSK